MTSKQQSTCVYYCNGSQRGKSANKRSKIEDLLLRNLSMFFTTQIYYVETSTSRGTYFDPLEARSKNILVVFVFYIDKYNIRDAFYRQEIVKCALRHQHIIFINNTSSKSTSTLVKFRGITAWEKDQIHALLNASISVSKKSHEETVFRLIKDIKSRKVDIVEQSACRRSSILTRKSSSASNLLDKSKVDDFHLRRNNYPQGDSSRRNPISFFRKISKRKQENKTIKSPLLEGSEIKEGSRNFLFGNFSGTLRRRNRKQGDLEVSQLSLQKCFSQDISISRACSKTCLDQDVDFAIRGTEVNLEKRLTKRPWVNWKTKAASKQVQASVIPLAVNKLEETERRSSKESETLRSIGTPPETARSAPTSPPSTDVDSQKAELGEGETISGRHLIKVGTLSKSGSCQSLPHITVTHSAAQGSLDSTGSFLDELSSMPPVGYLEDFEHFCKYAIYMPEKSRRRSSQRFLIIRYPDDVSLLQSRDSNSELASSVCSSPNPYDVLETTPGYESESPLQSPETRRSIYPQPVPAFSIESCFPPIDLGKPTQGN